MTYSIRAAKAKDDLSPMIHAQPLDVSAADAVFTNPTRGLWVGALGDVSVLMLSGHAAVFLAVPAGSFLPIAVTTVYNADTDATGIVALF